MILPVQKTPPKADIRDLTVLLYGRNKIGKSSYCANADGALFLSTEPGLNHLDVFQAPISTWDEMLTACAEISAGNHPFKTIIIDTVDNAFRMCCEHVCKKHKIEHESDLGYGKGYALINNEFYRVLNKLALLPYGLFLISHSQEKEFETARGKVMRTVPTLPEKARKLVLGMVDLILYCDLEVTNDASGQQVIRRVVRTKPNAAYDAGDRTGRLPEVIDLDYRAFMKAFSEAPGLAGKTASAAPAPSNPPAALSNPSPAPAPAPSPAKPTAPASAPAAKPATATATTPSK